MIGAVITILVLFLMVKVFEKDRDDLDTFQLATVAVLPVLCIIVVRITLAFVYPNPTLTMLLPPILMVGLTFALLWKHLEIPALRSATYTIVVIVVNVGLEIFLAPD